MMDFTPQLLTLAVVVLLACMSPGPDFIAVTSHALSSRRAGIKVALGIAMGCALWAALAVFGLGLVLSEVSWAYEVIRIGGALYLIYLGGKLLFGARRAYGALGEAHAPVLERGALMRGLFVSLTNPKAAAFFGSLFVTVLPLGAPNWVAGSTIGIVFAVAVCWFSVVALMFSVSSVRSVYARARRWVDAVMGAVLIGLGARLATSS